MSTAAQGINYPDPWSPAEFTCGCGKKVILHMKAPTGFSFGPGDFFQHCDKGPSKILLGPLIAAWEMKDDGELIRIE